jgi:hypothetical protein
VLVIGTKCNPYLASLTFFYYRNVGGAVTKQPYLVSSQTVDNQVGLRYPKGVEKSEAPVIEDVVTSSQRIQSRLWPFMTHEGPGFHHQKETARVEMQCEGGLHTVLYIRDSGSSSVPTSSCRNKLLSTTAFCYSMQFERVVSLMMIN